jgi:hypothetical protein
VDADRVLAFRLARSGLAARRAGSLAEAAACPASDFARDAALLALAARAEDVTRAGYDAAVDAGEVVVAYVVRGAIHALDPRDHALYGRALIAEDERELTAQLGRQVKTLAAEHGFAPADALEEVAAATRDALADAPLDKNALHEAYRSRVRAELLPWCTGCGSYHVAPMLWRYGTVAAGARLDAARRYTLADPGDPPPAAEAVRRFLGWSGPSTAAGFGEWAGVAPAHARRLWAQLEGELAEVDGGSLLADDLAAFEDPPAAEGIRLLPPGDPYLQKANRPLLAPEAALRTRLFRPVASPGAVLQDGRLAGTWKARAKGKAVEVSVEPLRRLRRRELEVEAERIAALRGSTLLLTVD